MQEPIPSAKTPSGWRRAKLLAGTVALTMATFGSVAAVTAGTAYAFGYVQTQNYVISGAASVLSGVTAADSPATFPNTGNFTVKFGTPSVLVPTSGAAPVPGTTPYIGIADADPAAGTFNVVASEVVAATTVGIVDLNTGYTYNATGAWVVHGTAEGTLALAETAGNFLQVYLGGTGSINAGDTLAVTFPALNPAAAGTLNFYVNTSVNGTFEESSGISISAAAGAITLTASPQGLNEGAAYSVTNVTAAASPTITLDACTPVAAALCPGALAGVTFSQIASSYTVTDTTSGTALTVSSVAAGASTTFVGNVVITLSAAATAGHALTITAVGSNPTTVQTVNFVASSGAVVSASSSVTFGGQLVNVTVTPSNTGALASANYTIGFSVSSTGAMTVAAGHTIAIQGPAGTSFANESGALVSDTTSSAEGVVVGAGITLSTTKTTDDTISFLTPVAFADSDAVTVTVFGATNPAAGSYSGTSGLSVHTAQDPIAAYNATAYVIGPSVVTSSAPAVTVTPNTPGTLATYTVGPFKAASNLVGGTDMIQVEAINATGTEFPGTATLTDSTTTTGSQTMTASAGAGSATVTYKLAANVTAGDSLTLTMTSAVNPAGTPVGTNYYLELGANTVANNTNNAGTQGLVTPSLTFPNAASTYPDGAIVAFGSTDYVFAGGAAFATTSDTLALVEQVDHAKVITAPTGATAPTAAPRVGTLIVVSGFPTVYVVGTDGQLHAFSTPAQLQANGYDGAIIITVPDITNLTVGSDVGQVGAGATAAATSSDGAIVNSSGYYLVFAGGRAFGIPGPKILTAILKSEAAGTTPVAGTVSATATTTAIANGTVLTIGGGVFVAYGGALYPFHGPGQLAADGYAGSPSLGVPNVNGLTVASYTGS